MQIELVGITKAAKEDTNTLITEDPQKWFNNDDVTHGHLPYNYYNYKYITPISKKEKCEQHPFEIS